ncbi:unnamed protein product [Gadus morhua 'NCC']
MSPWQKGLSGEDGEKTSRESKECSSVCCSTCAALAEHDCEKIFEKRKICRECSLSKSGTEARPGATVYGCRQCNVPLHIECFGKHYRSNRK